MSFEDEMNDVKKSESTAKYINEPAVHIVEITSYKMSPKDHKGCPFIEFNFNSVVIIFVLMLLALLLIQIYLRYMIYTTISLK